MNIPEDCHLAYIVSHEAWYRDASRVPGENPHLSVSASAKGSGGGVAWEFSIEEMELGGKPVTRVKVFDDAYAAFGHLRDMLGAVDETERVSPYAEKPAGPRDGHAETVREALRLAQDTAPNAAAALRFAEALAATEGQ